MPVMSGDEAIPLVRQAAPDTTVVVISGLLENAVAPQVEALGAAAYVEKGTPVRVILERLRDVLGVAPGPSPDPLK